MKIAGTLLDESSSALAEYRVVAYHGDVNLKKERRLGGATTKKDGTFSFTISLARYPLGVNVRLAVLKGKQEVWSSPIHYNTQADLVVDATIPEAALGISEYERLTEKISPLLQGEKLAELRPGQIEYLVGRSEVAETQLDQLVAAARLHDEVDAVPEEAFYGLLSQGLSANVSDVVALTSREWKAAIEAAARGNFIAPLSRARQATTLALNDRKVAEALRSSSPVGVSAASFAAVALGENGKARKIAAHAARHDGVNDGFWRAVGRDRTITNADRKKLRNYAAISEFVGGDPDLVRRVAGYLTRRGHKVTPAALATIEAPKLRELMVAAAHASNNSLLEAIGAEGFKAYAATTADAIANRVAAAFPAEALRAE